MTDMIDSPNPVEPSRRRGLPWLVAGLVALLVTGGAIGLMAASDDDPNATGAATGTAQLASIQQACGHWRSGYAGSQAPSAGWCTAMAEWMASQTNGGHMTGSMMWGDPDRMRDSCQRWMSTNPNASLGSSTGASAWCSAMVESMAQNGAWNRGGMFGGPMMGG